MILVKNLVSFFMKYGLSLAIMVTIGIMMFSQSIAMVEAYHNPSQKSAARQQAEQWTKDIEAERKAKADAIKAAWDAFKTANAAWESAKVALKTAIQTGDSSQISSAQAAVDAAKITKDNAWNNYVKLRNS